jgi:hypothetical protein
LAVHPIFRSGMGEFCQVLGCRRVNPTVGEKRADEAVDECVKSLLYIPLQAYSL